MITEKQKELLKHMLGADERYLKKQWGYRNHFCAGDENDRDRIELEKLENLGMVISYQKFGYKTFSATKQGAIEIGFKPYQLKNAGLVG